MMEQPTPAAANSTAPNGAPVAAPGTSRPDVQTYRAMQSMNARIQAMGSQLQQAMGMLGEQQQARAVADDQAFRDNVMARLESGEISAADAALDVSERVALRHAAPPPGPPPPPVHVEEVQQQIGIQAILRGLGLSGQEAGLDYSSPRALVDSGQRAIAARAATQATDHDELVAEAARRQGLVIPHRDGGRPTSMNQPISQGDVQRLA